MIPKQVSLKPTNSSSLYSGGYRSRGRGRERSRHVAPDETSVLAGITGNRQLIHWVIRLLLGNDNNGTGILVVGGYAGKVTEVTRRANNAEEKTQFFIHNIQIGSIIVEQIKRLNYTNLY